MQLSIFCMCASQKRQTKKSAAARRESPSYTPSLLSIYYSGASMLTTDRRPPAPRRPMIVSASCPRPPIQSSMTDANVRADLIPYSHHATSSLLPSKRRYGVVALVPSTPMYWRFRYVLPPAVWYWSRTVLPRQQAALVQLIS